MINEWATTIRGGLDGRGIDTNRLKAVVVV